ncbi:MAG: TetR/AcrR family transcriptional regulator [Clostridia bacterium]|nr:TetR/AcrR family transcriptional regulator [Clostridia bacterium]
MKNERIYREVFINNTIRLVAEGGFEKATTRAIAGERKEINNVKLNEAHIYRVFGTKENLFAETFSMLDNELISNIKESLSAFDTGANFRSQCENLFLKLWRLLLQNEDKCRYYTRYYYSIYFKESIRKAHMKKYEILIERMTPAFVPGADVWSLFHHIITVMLDFAIRVYNGAIEDTKDNAAHIFNVAYSSITPYLK